MPSRPTGSRANPILQEPLWTSQWPEWSASPGGHGGNRAEDLLSGAGRFRKALQPGHCPCNRERTAVRGNSSRRGGRSGTLRERSARLGPFGPGSTAGDFLCDCASPQLGRASLSYLFVFVRESPYVGIPGNTSAAHQRVLRLPALRLGHADGDAGADVGLPGLPGERRAASTGGLCRRGERAVRPRCGECGGDRRPRAASRGASYRTATAISPQPSSARIKRLTPQ
jgi:hypothetical protein